MRLVARKARYLSSNEAPALRQIHRLMANIPWVRPIGVLCNGDFSMARAAKFIHGNSTHPFRIYNSMILTRTMATLTANTHLRRHNSRSRLQAQRPRRMTLKASQNRRVRIEDAILYAAARGMAWCQRQLIRTRVMRKPVLKVILVVDTADKRDSLVACPKRPRACVS